MQMYGSEPIDFSKIPAGCEIFAHKAWSPESFELLDRYEELGNHLLARHEKQEITLSPEIVTTIKLMNKACIDFYRYRLYMYLVENRDIVAEIDAKQTALLRTNQALTTANHDDEREV